MLFTTNQQSFHVHSCGKTVELQSTEGREGPGENGEPALNSPLINRDLATVLMILVL